MTNDGGRGQGRKRQRRLDEADQPAPKRAPALLSWMRHASLIDEDTSAADNLAPELDERLLTSLSAGGISRLFPVQAAVWTALRGGSFDARDICVNAPTGSGKTLAYVLPVVSALRNRVVCRLRALVVLPTHDLAMQVCPSRAVAV
jgi:ATP-dependent RNA helicase DDX51/DBP6